MTQSHQIVAQGTVPPALTESGSTPLVTAAGAVIGAAIALALGLVWVALARDGGFADLAAAAVTKVLVVPVGALVGGIAGWRRSRTA